MGPLPSWFQESVHFTKPLVLFPAKCSCPLSHTWGFCLKVRGTGLEKRVHSNSLLGMDTFPIAIKIMRVCSVASVVTLCDPIDCSPPDSSVHGILQARILEYALRGSSQLKDRTHISCASCHCAQSSCWATREAQLKQWKWKSLSPVWLFATPWTIYSPWNSPGQNTEEGSLSLLQGIFPTQGSNPGLHKGIKTMLCIIIQNSDPLMYYCKQVDNWMKTFPWSHSFHTLCEKEKIPV